MPSTSIRSVGAAGVLALSAGLVPHAGAQWTAVSLHPTGSASVVGSRAFGVDGASEVGQQVNLSTSTAVTWQGTPASIQTLTANALQAAAYGVDGAVRVGDAAIIVGAPLGTQPFGRVWGPVTFNLSPSFPSNASYARGTHAGQAVGWMGTIGTTSADRAWLWTNVIQFGNSGADLHPPGAAGTSRALDVHAGKQVGFVQITGGPRAALWAGSAESLVDLHPAGATESVAHGVHLAQQAGSATVGGVTRAALWTGTAASLVDLHPAGATSSTAYDTHSGWQVGTATIAGVKRAVAWQGTAATMVDLSAVLPGAWTNAEARGVWADATRVRVVGVGTSPTGREEALLWTFTAPPPCYPNCDGSTSAPTLNALDFGCFLNRYIAGDPYANCDASTSAPALNALDFSCFLTRYRNGCN